MDLNSNNIPPYIALLNSYAVNRSRFNWNPGHDTVQLNISMDPEAHCLFAGIRLLIVHDTQQQPSDEIRGTLDLEKSVGFLHVSYSSYPKNLSMCFNSSFEKFPNSFQILVAHVGNHWVLQRIGNYLDFGGVTRRPIHLFHS
jgi:hypothetical protein